MLVFRVVVGGGSERRFEAASLPHLPVRSALLSLSFCLTTNCSLAHRHMVIMVGPHEDMSVTL